MSNIDYTLRIKFDSYLDALLDETGCKKLESKITVCEFMRNVGLVHLGAVQSQGIDGTWIPHGIFVATDKLKEVVDSYPDWIGPSFP